jgi:site-specific DNA-methyltransferase (adenine-specific)
MLERNRVYKGDCLELMKDIGAGSVDMILCDLPYGTTQSKWDIIIPFEPLWKQYKRIIKDKGAIVLTAAQPFTSALVMSNPSMFRYCMVWEKPLATGFLNAKKMPLRAHEDICCFYKKLPVYNPQKTFGHQRKTATKHNAESECYGKMLKNQKYDSTERYPRSVVKFKSDNQREKIHQNQKPVALFEYLIKTYTNEGDLVLDNCAGSGTTAIACLRTDRDYILMEQEQKYFDIIKQRIEKRQDGNDGQ